VADISKADMDRARGVLQRLIAAQHGQNAEMIEEELLKATRQAVAGTPEECFEKVAALLYVAAVMADGLAGAFAGSELRAAAAENDDQDDNDPEFYEAAYQQILLQIDRALEDAPGESQ